MRDLAQPLRTRRLLRRPMATPVQPPPNGDQLAERFLLACAAVIVLALVIWDWQS